MCCNVTQGAKASAPVTTGARILLTTMIQKILRHFVERQLVKSGNTKGGSITVLLTSCLTGLD
jgi:hypothetical protein